MGREERMDAFMCVFNNGTAVYGYGGVGVSMTIFSFSLFSSLLFHPVQLSLLLLLLVHQS